MSGCFTLPLPASAPSPSPPPPPLSLTINVCDSPAMLHATIICAGRRQPGSRSHDQIPPDRQTDGQHLMLPLALHLQPLPELDSSWDCLDCSYCQLPVAICLFSSSPVLQFSVLSCLCCRLLPLRRSELIDFQSIGSIMQPRTASTSASASSSHTHLHASPILIAIRSLSQSLGSTNRAK